MAKKCPPGKYYCFNDKKCKKIPRGYHIGARGYLARDNRSDSDGDDGSNGNGSSNGNGNGGNGSGNVRLLATPTSSSSTVFKVIATLTKV